MGTGIGLGFGAACAVLCASAHAAVLSAPTLLKAKTVAICAGPGAEFDPLRETEPQTLLQLRAGF